MDERWNYETEKKGFTLLEMLIVVAVVAILIAIAIPTFSASLTRARAAACQANRRSLKALLSVEYMCGESERISEGTIALTDEEREKYTCPQGGTYTATIRNGVVSVVCSIEEHSDDYEGGEAALNTNRQNMYSSIIQKFPINYTEKDVNSDYTDYSARETETDKLLNSLPQEYRDVLSNSVWQVTQSTFTWTSVEYGDVAVGNNDKANHLIPAIQYNETTGQYSVGMNYIKPSTTMASNPHGRLVINTFKADSSYASYTEALAAYNEALEAFNNP